VTSRAVAWGDLENAWDLGGQPTPSGPTRFGRVFRSMRLDDLDAEGWAALAASGTRSIVDLRNDDEVTAATDRPGAIALARCPIEDQSDSEFMAVWGERLGSPAYYSEILRRWPALVVAALGAIADAPGPVLFHCGAGRDRTGMISAMIGQLVGVHKPAILDDYENAVRAFNAWKKSHPNREAHQSNAELEAHLITARAELRMFLDEFDFEAYLLGAGLAPGQIARIRSRLLDD
jgi:protein-tyrosine phosphatase